MSRVAKSPIPVPESVKVTLDGLKITVKGKLGELSYVRPAVVGLSEDSENKVLNVDGANDPALGGLVRALVNNMVVGVSTGFECKLELKGVGYRAKVSGNTLNLSVGFSHPVNMEMPEGVSVACPSQTLIVVSGPDKQKVFQVGANIRSVRPPEPYKGKGIRYQDERVVMKEVKKK